MVERKLLIVPIVFFFLRVWDLVNDILFLCHGKASHDLRHHKWLLLLTVSLITYVTQHEKTGLIMWPHFWISNFNNFISNQRSLIFTRKSYRILKCLTVKEIATLQNMNRYILCCLYHAGSHICMYYDLQLAIAMCIAALKPDWRC